MQGRCLLTCMTPLIVRHMPAGMAWHGPDAPHCCRHFCLGLAISHIGGGAGWGLGGGGQSMDGYLWGTHVLAVPAWYGCARGMYGDNCGIFAGKARPAPHLIQPCPEWCVHTSLLIQPAGEEEVHRAVHSLRFTAHLARVLVVHMKPLSPGATFTEKSPL